MRSVHGIFVTHTIRIPSYDSVVLYLNHLDSLALCKSSSEFILTLSVRVSSEEEVSAQSSYVPAVLADEVEAVSKRRLNRSCKGNAVEDSFRPLGCVGEFHLIATGSGNSDGTEFFHTGIAMLTTFVHSTDFCLSFKKSDTIVMTVRSGDVNRNIEGTSFRKGYVPNSVFVICRARFEGDSAVLNRSVCR